MRNESAVLDVDGSSQFSADSQPKSIGVTDNYICNSLSWPKNKDLELTIWQPLEGENCKFFLGGGNPPKTPGMNTAPPPGAPGISRSESCSTVS